MKLQVFAPCKHDYYCLIYFRENGINAVTCGGVVRRDRSGFPECLKADSCAFERKNERGAMRYVRDEQGELVIDTD